MDGYIAAGILGSTLRAPKVYYPTRFTPDVEELESVLLTEGPFESVYLVDVNFNETPEAYELLKDIPLKVMYDHHGVTPPEDWVNECKDIGSAALLVVEKTHARVNRVLIDYINAYDSWTFGDRYEAIVGTMSIVDCWPREYLYEVAYDPKLLVKFHMARELGADFYKGYAESIYRAYEPRALVTIEGLDVQLFECDYFQHWNILAHEYMNRSNEPRVGIYKFFSNNVKISFRSTDQTAYKLAKSLGGGGHPDAAGATITFAKFYKL